MVSGSLRGYAIVDFVHAVDFQVVYQVYTYVPATLSVSFGIVNNPFPIGREQYVNFISISDPDYSRSIRPGYDGPNDSTVNITDGIPGTSADTAFASTDVYINRYDQTIPATVNLTDPTGEYIGPNGDGDPSQVTINAYIPISSLNVLGMAITVHSPS